MSAFRWGTTSRPYRCDCRRVTGNKRFESKCKRCDNSNLICLESFQWVTANHHKMWLFLPRKGNLFVTYILMVPLHWMWPLSIDLYRLQMWSCNDQIDLQCENKSNTLNRKPEIQAPDSLYRRRTAIGLSSVLLTLIPLHRSILLTGYLYKVPKMTSQIRFSRIGFFWLSSNGHNFTKNQ